MKAVVWPAVVGYALWLFRSNLPSTLNDLLARITSAKAAGLELNFGKKLDTAEEILPPPAQTITAEAIKAEMKLGHASVTIGEPTLTSESEEVERLLNAYEIGIGLPPAYIVTQAWLRFEEEVQLYLQFRGVNLEGRRTVASFNLSRLENDGLFSPDEFAELSELRTLRNRVAHETNMCITRTDALRYNDIINGLINRIRLKRLPI